MYPQAEFDLNFSDGGVLGALVYLGLVVGAPITGWALTNFKSQVRKTPSWPRSWANFSL